jgi:hypothetical protein
VMCGVISRPPLAAVLSKMHRESSEAGEGVRLVVVVGVETQSLVVLNSMGDIGNSEDRLVADDLNRPAGSLDLKVSLAVHPVDALIADPNVGSGPQLDEPASERLLTAATRRDLGLVAHRARLPS